MRREGVVPVPEMLAAIERLPTRRAATVILLHLIERELRQASSIEKLWLMMALRELRERPSIKCA